MKRKYKKEKIKIEKRNIYFKKNYTKIINKIDFSKDKIINLTKRRNGEITSIIKKGSYIIRLNFFIELDINIKKDILVCYVLYLISNNKIKKLSNRNILKKFSRKRKFKILYPNELKLISNFLNTENNNIILNHLIENTKRTILKESIYNFVNENNKFKIDLNLK